MEVPTQPPVGSSLFPEAPLEAASESLFGDSSRGMRLLACPGLKNGPPSLSEVSHLEQEAGSTLNSEIGRGPLPSQPDQPHSPS